MKYIHSINTLAANLPTRVIHSRWGVPSKARGHVLLILSTSDVSVSCPKLGMPAHQDLKTSLHCEWSLSTFWILWHPPCSPGEGLQQRHLGGTNRSKAPMHLELLVALSWQCFNGSWILLRVHQTQEEVLVCQGESTRICWKETTQKTSCGHNTSRFSQNGLRL